MEEPKGTQKTKDALRLLGDAAQDAGKAGSMSKALTSEATQVAMFELFGNVPAVLIIEQNGKRGLFSTLEDEAMIEMLRWALDRLTN